MLALSTSFYPLDQAAPQALADFLRELGVDRVELEYRIPRAVLPELRAVLRSAGISPVSVHNICPRAEGAPPGVSANTFFHLAHLDGEIRRQTLQMALGTLELAHEVEARAVVLHCGRVAMDDRFDDLVTLYQQGRIDTPQADQLRRSRLELLGRMQPRHRDALYFSLERLLESARKYDLILGLENRFHYFDLPGATDFDDIFRVFAGAPVGYWHDAGHAWVNEQLRFQAPGAVIAAQASRLVGMHLHDARGLDDHLPPGQGHMDLRSLAGHLTPQTPLVIELAAETPLDQVARGVTWVRDHFLSRVGTPPPNGTESRPAP